MFSLRGKVNWEFWIPAIGGTALVVWYLVIPSWQNISGQWRSASWPSTTGRVTASKTIESYQRERTTKVYRFSYEYVVEGERYEGNRYSFRFASGDHSSAVKKLGSGDEITVYFDPSNPNQSVIARDSGVWWNYVVLSSLVIVPIAVFLRFRNVSSPSA